MGPVKLLSSSWLGLIISSGGTINSIGWAHCTLLLLLPISSNGPIIFYEALLVHSDRPIALAAAAADFLKWAHDFFIRHHQCTQIGPL